VVIKDRNGERRRPPTVKDVAREARVSTMTVSRVVNGENGVSPELRSRVEAAIAAVGYSQNKAARSLALGEPRIGLLYSNPSFAYLNEFLVGSLHEATLQNVQLIVQNCNDERTELEALIRLIGMQVEGVVLTPPICESIEILEEIRKRNLPIVAVASNGAPDWALSVSVDDNKAAYAMTKHLISLGHSRIAFITGDPRHSASAARLQGYRSALTDAGLDERPELIALGRFTYRSGLDAAEELLDLAERPTAIFASNDDMAAACIAIAHQRGYDVPGDLTICGFDDTVLATTIWPELTTIRQPIFDMSRTAVQLLVKQIRRPPSQPVDTRASHIQIDYQLMRRQSDAAPRRRPRPSQSFTVVGD
jgi:LacI family transcriptional regulator